MAIAPRVFVVQNTHKWDRVRQELVPKFDLSSARQYGDIVELLSQSANPFSPDAVIAELRYKLHDFSDADFILCLGSPILIGWATALAAMVNNGNVAMLQWSGQQENYSLVRACVLPAPQPMQAVPI